MRKKFRFLISLFLILGLLPSIAGAVSSRCQSQTGQTATTTTTTANTEETATQAKIQATIEETVPTYTSSNSVSQERSTAVTTVVESLVIISYQVDNTVVGEEIRTIAQEQSTSTDTTNQAIDNSQRNPVIEFIIGPDYNDLKKVKEEKENNNNRIDQLKELSKTVKDKKVKSDLDKQITVLEEQNTALDKQLAKEANQFSLLGWAAKLITKY